MFIGGGKVCRFVPRWLGGKENGVWHAQKTVGGATQAAEMIDSEGDKGTVFLSDGGDDVTLCCCRRGASLMFVANGFEV